MISVLGKSAPYFLDMRAEFHGITLIDPILFDQRNRRAQYVILYKGVLIVKLAEKRALVWLYSGGRIFTAGHQIRSGYRLILATALYKIGMLTARQVDEEKSNRAGGMISAKNAAA